jgi:hypothetical protein
LLETDPSRAAARSFRLPTQTYLCAVAPDTLLFGRGVNLNVGVLACDQLILALETGVIGQLSERCFARAGLNSPMARVRRRPDAAGI